MISLQNHPQQSSGSNPLIIFPKEWQRSFGNIPLIAREFYATKNIYYRQKFECRITAHTLYADGCGVAFQ